MTSGASAVAHSGQAVIASRLETAELSAEVRALITAAFTGRAAAETALRTGRAGEQQTPSATGAYGDGTLWLERLSVAGFRGIEEPLELAFDPRPGLTLVVGQNGSGKSSLAEALEWAVAGRCARLTEPEQNREWWQGVVNQRSADGSAAIAVTLEERADGETAALELALRLEGAKNRLKNTAVTAARNGDADRGLAGAIHAATRIHRPFLAHHQLARAFEKSNSPLRAIAPALGLQEVLDARDVLSSLREPAHELTGPTREERQAIATRLRHLADHFHDPSLALRADRLAAGGASTPMPGPVPADGGDVRAVSVALTTTAVPSQDEVRQALEAVGRARDRVAALADGASAIADELAEALTRVVAAAEAHGLPAGSACPVCSAPLGATWQAEAQERLDAHMRRSAERQQARSQLAEHMGRLRALFENHVRSERLASAAAELEITEETVASIMRGETLLADPRARWCAESEQQVLAMRAGLAAAAACAASHHASLSEERDQLVREADRVNADDATARQRAIEMSRLEAARSWLIREVNEIADERFSAVRDEIMLAWGALRQTSSVSLEQVDVRITQGANRGTIQMAAQVDGTPVHPFSVVSQGELYSLALSLFVPYSTADSSPFRFAVIDDPVQSMDPAKVDGLACLLESLARTRQVVVFTHDLRLERAVDKLGIEATFVHVKRARTDVRLEIRSSTSAAMLLSDARKVLNSPLPADVRCQVVPVLLRQSLEAACVGAIAQLPPRSPQPQLPGLEADEMEARLASARTLADYLSRALGVAGTGDVWKPLLDRHVSHHGDGRDCERDVELAKQLNRWSHQASAPTVAELTEVSASVAALTATFEQRR